MKSHVLHDSAYGALLAGVCLGRQDLKAGGFAELDQDFHTPVLNRIPGMAPHMAPIFIELLSRLQRPPSTRSLIANEAAMESTALLFLVSALSFHEARDAEEKMCFSAASSRGQERMTARDSFFAPPAATVTAAGSA